MYTCTQSSSSVNILIQRGPKVVRFQFLVVVRQVQNNKQKQMSRDHYSYSVRQLIFVRIYSYLTYYSAPKWIRSDNYSYHTIILTTREPCRLWSEVPVPREIVRGPWEVLARHGWGRSHQTCSLWTLVRTRPGEGLRIEIDGQDTETATLRHGARLWWFCRPSAIVIPRLYIKSYCFATFIGLCLRDCFPCLVVVDS